MRITTNGIHSDLFFTQKNVYEPNKLILSNLVQEAEGHKYGACAFEINGHRIQFRTAKITPKKIGRLLPVGNE